jgi:hypothetical protein
MSGFAITLKISERGMFLKAGISTVKPKVIASYIKKKAIVIASFAYFRKLKKRSEA